jgi:hypothetical protein
MEITSSIHQLKNCIFLFWNLNKFLYLELRCNLKYTGVLDEFQLIQDTRPQQQE